MTTFNRPDPDPIPGELLTFTPVAVVVFELIERAPSATRESRIVGWAWGRVTPGVIGFDEIVYTPVGGGDPITRPDRAELGAHLFTY